RRIPRPAPADRRRRPAPGRGTDAGRSPIATAAPGRRRRGRRRRPDRRIGAAGLTGSAAGPAARLPGPAARLPGPAARSAALDDEHGVRAGCEGREMVRLIARVREVVADAELIGLSEHLDACGSATEDDVLDGALRMRLGSLRLTRLGLNEVDIAPGVRRRGA